MSFASRRHSGRRRPAMAMVIVLMLLATGTILGSVLLAQSSLSGQTSLAMGEAVSAAYLAESGVEHAACLLRENPEAIQAAAGSVLGPYGLPGSDETYSLRVDAQTTPGFFNVTASSALGRASQSAAAVIRHTWGRQVMINHALVCLGGGNASTGAGQKIYGDVHGNGNMYNAGLIVGDFSASRSALSYGSVYSGCIKSYQDKVLAPVFTASNYYLYAWGDRVGEAVFKTDNYLSQTETFARGASMTEENPAGVVVVRPSSGTTRIQNGFTFSGTLVVEGDLVIDGDEAELEAPNGFPALIVTGKIILDDDCDVQITGVVYCSGGISPAVNNLTSIRSTVVGAIVCENTGVYPLLNGEHILQYRSDLCSLLDPTGYGDGGKVEVYRWAR